MKEPLWEHKAFNLGSDAFSILSFGWDLSGFKFIIAAIIPLFASATISIKVFGYVLIFILALIMYHLLKEAYDRLWVRNNLVYAVTSDSITFHWNNNDTEPDLVVPLSDISKVILVANKNLDTSSIYFSVLSNEVYFKEFAFLCGEDQPMLSFQKIPEAQAVYELIQDQRVLDSNAYLPSPKKEEGSFRLDYKLTRNLILAFAFIVLLIGCYAGLQLCDYFFNQSELVEGVIVSETLYKKGGDYLGITLVTDQGHRFASDFSPGSRIGRPVTYKYCRMFKDVTFVELGGHDVTDYIFSNYNYGGIVLRLLIIFLCFFSTCYIVIKAGLVPLIDLFFFLLLPILTGIVIYGVFSF